ncbi:MAG: hypothetical protein LBI02_00910, partial [Opitutaceae bacterium]|nr:hypothetical protein [Opitutaceae bacterium]
AFSLPRFCKTYFNEVELSLIGKVYINLHIIPTLLFRFSLTSLLPHPSLSFLLPPPAFPLPPQG